MPAEDQWRELGFTDLGIKEREQTIDEIKEFLLELDERHPEVFDDESFTPTDYQRELKPAIFSLGGTLRQQHGASNEDTVQEVFLEPAREAGKLTYTDQRGAERIDFKGRLTQTDQIFALDVKGGEGQSIGHLLVPSNTDTLVLWSERNARNTKSPGSRLNEVINRAVRWGFNNDEDVTAMVNRDEPAGARTPSGQVIPDVAVFPEYFPTLSEPNPPLQDLDALHIVEVLYDTLIGEGDLYSDSVQKHLWFHELRLEEKTGGHVVKKDIYNAYDNDIKLQTQSIDYERISEVS